MASPDHGKNFQHRSTPNNVLWAGYSLHWYRIDGVIGQGGFGITYLAEDQNLREKVAIKEYFPTPIATRAADSSVREVSEAHLEDYRQGLKRFVIEARTLTQFRHACIVRVRSVFEENNTAYMVMDYLDGKSLASALREKRKFSEEELLSLFLPLTEGLERVHLAGFIHRDIKPANIILAEGRAVLIDFGSARQAIGRGSLSLTQIVSSGYAPFEQYHSKGEQQGPWTDIYAMGATLYRAVAGVPPSPAIDRSKALLETSRDTYVSVGALCDEAFSPAFRTAVDHALAFRAVDRPQTVAEWRAELKGVHVAITDTESPTGEVEKQEGQWSEKERNAIRAQLERVLGSRTFATAAQLQRLLRYLVDETLAGRGHRLNQASIAIDVLGKGAEFDAALDARVRVEARRLRSRLTEYYYTEGGKDAIRFELPKGHYVPAIILGPAPEKTGIPAAVDSVKSVPYRIRSVSRSAISTPAIARRSVFTVVGLLAATSFVAIAGYQFWNRQTSALAGVPGSPSGKTTVPDQPSKVAGGTPPASGPSGPVATAASIAVMPFVDMSGDPGNEYFSDGLSEELLNGLARVPGLRVASRTSSFYFKNKTEDAPAIGRMLGVRHLLEGSVRREGERMRVTVRLVNAENGYQIWSEAFDRQVADIFAIQEEIAMAVLAKLKLAVVSREDAAAGGRTTSNPEALDKYLRGRHLYLSWQPERIDKGIEYLEQAIRADPGFSPAYVSLAEALFAKGLAGRLSRKDQDALDERRRKLLERALELDPENADAIAVLAYAMLTYSGFPPDLERVERELQRAEAISPNSETVLRQLTWFYSGLGWPPERAVDYARRQYQRDPLNPIAALGLAQAYFGTHQFEQQLAAADRVLELDPGFFPAHTQRAMALNELGRYQEALESGMRAAELRGTSAGGYEDVHWAHARLGRREVAEAIYERYGPLWLRGDRALALAAMERYEEALQELEQGFREEDHRVLFALTWSLLIPVHNDPRFQALVRASGLDRRVQYAREAYAARRGTVPGA
ncbi:MAG: protein kinase [Gammaproteobacteria bacterium]|nr:protein kinase [Gammaproteobacteria bacterium]